MRTAQNGDKVRIHYTGRFETGEVFDSSVGSDPFEFELGASQVIAGFEHAVRGMKIGDKKTVAIEPQDAYGDHNDSLVLVMPRDSFPEGVTPEVGMCMQLVDENENGLPVVVTEIAGDQITLDANHPLAGMPLTFEIELLEIVGGLIITP